MLRAADDAGDLRQRRRVGGRRRQVQQLQRRAREDARATTELHEEILNKEDLTFMMILKKKSEPSSYGTLKGPPIPLLV